jgi:DNA-binding CsgD family transcriptional regulator/N-acetylneuraminic acid mutarotase
MLCTPARTKWAKCYNFEAMPEEGSNELSERELDILKLVATGASNKEIAQQLYISSNTVKVHLRNIFTKIEVSSRTEAAMYAVRTGLVIHASDQLLAETEQGSANAGDLTAQPTSNGGTLVPTGSRKYNRWAPYFLVAGLLGLIFLGLRLSPGLALFNTPTNTPLPPKDTPTPVPRWKHLAVIPDGKRDPAVVSYADQVYVIGGVNSGGATGDIDRYDPLTDSWSALSPKPVAVFNVQVAVINGLIYIPGGRTDESILQPTDILEIYDTNTDKWHTGSALPVPLSAYGLVAYDGDLYVFGGWDGQQYRNSVFSYDPTDDAWQERTPMPTARGFCGAVEAGGRIYVMGGIDGDQSVDANEIYSPARDNNNNKPWASGFPIPESRYGVRAANIADTIYVFGGETENSNRVGLIYFPQTNIWQSLETALFPLGEDFGIVSIGTNLYFIGGISDGVYSNQNITYQAIITLSIPIIIR